MNDLFPVPVFLRVMHNPKLKLVFVGSNQITTSKHNMTATGILCKAKSAFAHGGIGAQHASNSGLNYALMNTESNITDWVVELLTDPTTDEYIQYTSVSEWRKDAKNVYAEFTEQGYTALGKPIPRSKRGEGQIGDRGWGVGSVNLPLDKLKALINKMLVGTEYTYDTIPMEYRVMIREACTGVNATLETRRDLYFMLKDLGLV